MLDPVSSRWAIRPPDSDPWRPSVYECGDQLFRPHYRQRGPGLREEVRVFIHLLEFQSSTHRGGRVTGYRLGH